MLGIYVWGQASRAADTSIPARWWDMSSRERRYIRSRVRRSRYWRRDRHSTSQQTVIANFGNASQVEPMTFIAFYLKDGEQDLIRMLDGESS